MESKTEDGHSALAMEILVTPETPLQQENGKVDLSRNHSGNKVKDDDHDDDDDDDDDDEKDVSQLAGSSSGLCCLYRGIYQVRRFLRENWLLLKRLIYGLLVLAYLGYFSYCMYYRFGDEPSIRLLVVTVIGLFCLVKCFVKCPKTLPLAKFFRRKRLRKVVRWSLYLLSVGGAVAIVALDVVTNRPENLICLAGIAVLILSSCFFSRRPEKINWHVVFWAMSLQFWFAVLIGKNNFGKAAFQWLSERTVEFLKFSDTGAMATFGESYTDHRLVFQMMPTVIFFNAMISVLYYLGVVQVIFGEFGRFLSFCIGTSPIESVAAAANLFLSLLETSLLIRPFVKDITQSELFAAMTAGFSSVAGSLLWVYAGFGAPMNHILTASVMSAPAALAFAKLIYPDERKPTIKAEDAYRVAIGQYGSLLGALSAGAKDGMKMAALVVVNLMVYMSVLDFLDHTVLWFAQRAGLHVTLSKVMAYLFYPFPYLMGFEAQECFKAAELLGMKILTLTTVAFKELGDLTTNNQRLQDYMDTYNSTWTYIGDDIFLEATNTTLVKGVLTERSGILATYMLCGLSNLTCIGITVGAYISVAPSRTKDIFKQAGLACLAGNLACISTACVAGLLYTD